MTNRALAQSYLFKARKRLKALEVLLAEESYSDVVREAQELVELALKGILREMGVDPPKQHDVGGLLLEMVHLLPPEVARHAPRMARVSRWLRKEREFALYGDVDFVPTEEYTRKDAERALRDARFVLRMAERVIPEQG